MASTRATPGIVWKTVEQFPETERSGCNAGPRLKTVKSSQCAGKNNMALALENLVLIDKLCACYEEKFNDESENSSAAEFMRVIRAVATDGRVALMAEGDVAKVLIEDFPVGHILWRHVIVSSIVM